VSSYIDVCVEFIETKNAHYLAKEGQVVYFASLTGRNSDFTWHKMTPTEVLRVIKATRLNAEQSALIKIEHLVAAFQELGRVYEFGVKTRHKVAPEIFNYSEHSNESIGDGMMSILVDELQKHNLFALYMLEVIELFNLAKSRMLCTSIGSKESRELLFKHFEASGYEIRTGAKRVFIDNKKTPVIMKPGLKPSQVESLPLTVAEAILRKIRKELE
jgi:hypothetical protein